MFLGGRWKKLRFYSLKTLCVALKNERIGENNLNRIVLSRDGI